MPMLERLLINFLVCFVFTLTAAEVRAFTVGDYMSMGDDTRMKWFLNGIVEGFVWGKQTGSHFCARQKNALTLCSLKQR
jgi:hypothetical protein